MAKKRLSEGMIGKFMDSVVDSLKKGNLKKIQKRIDKDVGLTKSLKDLEKSWDKFHNELVDKYGDEQVKSWKNMSDDEWKKLSGRLDKIAKG